MRATKGSDKWGQGSGPRIEIALAVLVVVSAVGVYFFYIESSGLTSGGLATGGTTISTTGIRCDSDSVPPLAQQAEQDPGFTGLSGGLCYNYLGQSLSRADGTELLSFGYYNGTIAYPCGTSPQELPQSVIQVAVTSTQKIGAVVLLDTSAIDQQFGQHESCDLSVPVKVVSLADVESTIPAVPQLNLTVTLPFGGRPLTSLRAALTLDGGTQTFQFGGVTSSAPLTPPHSISSTEIVLSGVSFTSDEVYPMTISGTFDNGQTFSIPVHVQIAQVP